MDRYLFALLSAFFLVVMGCGSHESEIIKRVTDASKKGTVIDFRSVADGDWDRLLVFRPYTPKQTIENKIGSSWSGAHKIEMRDDIYLLVFARGNDVVAYALVPRNFAEFHLPDFHEAPEIPLDQAVFEYTGKEKHLARLSSGQRK